MSLNQQTLSCLEAEWAVQTGLTAYLFAQGHVSERSSCEVKFYMFIISFIDVQRNLQIYTTFKQLQHVFVYFYYLWLISTKRLLTNSLYHCKQAFLPLQRKHD